MKKMSIMMALAIASLTASAQKSKDIDTLQVTTAPQMHCANCEKKIKGEHPLCEGSEEDRDIGTQTDSYHRLRPQKE